MLQRLKLQTHSGTSTLESTPFALIEGNVRTTESSSETPIYQFGASLETKQQGRIASIYTKPDSPRTFQSSGLKSATQTPPKQPAREIKVHNSGVSTWGFSSERNSDAISSTDVASTPRRIKKQLNFLRRKANEDNSSVPSFPTTDDTLNPPDLSLLSPASATPGYKVSEALDQEAIWSGTAGNGMGGTISVSESTTQPRTSRKKKRANPGHKRWTQKVKERWRERRNNRDKQEQNEVAKRRMENTRHVRFAKEVVILPPLILSEDENENEHDDDDDDDDDFDDVDDDGDDEGDQSDEECQEEPLPRPSVSSWIFALRSKAKKKAKLKLKHNWPSLNPQNH
ncbi:hypothetical protein P4O66_003851 [Electrophorus voltai]|uniref:Uncharacterized protein n=1 Tax=Electrophorus voltai TaxID=2609070 RepID=A0AAD9E6J1_9TELE|nr:hypothetical protein P4O66_003851 [Electrophorus voltai]